MVNGLLAPMVWHVILNWPYPPSLPPTQVGQAGKDRNYKNCLSIQKQLSRGLT